MLVYVTDLNHHFVSMYINDCIVCLNDVLLFFRSSLLWSIQYNSLFILLVTGRMWLNVFQCCWKIFLGGISIVHFFIWLCLFQVYYFLLIAVWSHQLLEMVWWYFIQIVKMISYMMIERIHACTCCELFNNYYFNHLNILVPIDYFTCHHVIGIFVNVTKLINHFSVYQHPKQLWYKSLSSNIYV